MDVKLGTLQLPGKGKKFYAGAVWQHAPNGVTSVTSPVNCDTPGDALIWLGRALNNIGAEHD